MTLLYLAPEAMVRPLTGGRERARRVLRWLAARRPLHLAACADEAEARALEALAREAGLAGLTVLPYPAGWRGYGGLRGRVARLAREMAFTAVHCVGHELWAAAQRVPLGAGGRRVLELHDVPEHWRRGMDERSDAWQRQAVLKTLAAADDIIAVSDAERDLLRAWGCTARVQVAGNGVDLDYWGAVEAAEDAGPVMLFPAAFNWPPNEAAARALVEAVLPLVREQVPDATVRLAGRRPGPGVRALADRPRVELLADVEDMRPLFARARLIVVPTRAEGGTRLKILQAMAAGRAVVSTPEGASGLGLMAGRDLVVAPLVEAFAGEAARLLMDTEAREALVNAGQAAARRFGWETVLGALDDVYPAAA